MHNVRQSPIFYSHAPDGELAFHTLQGEESAFETLVKRYYPPLFPFIYHLVNDYDKTNDILQQVMIQLYISLPTLHQEKSFKAWLFRVAHNRTIDELRKRHSIYFSEMETDSADETELIEMIDCKPLPDEVAEYHELQMVVREAIQQLPDHYREIVRLRYLSQMTFREIGQVIGIPEATVKTYFHRAKPLLAEAFHVKSIYDLLP